MVFPGGKSVGCDDEQTDPKGSTRAFGLGLSAKRAFDIVAATFGVALFAPILLITAIAIKLNYPGPILIRETLFGYGRRPVRLHKFRFATHTPETQLITAPLTRIGRMMGRTGIGELPQLFSVLFGEVSIVGPRPYISEQDLPDFPRAILLNSIRPGILDCASPGHFRTAEQRVKDDLYYAANQSPILDIKIILTALFAERSIEHDTSLLGPKIARVQKG